MRTEASIEWAVVAYAKSLGLVAIKMASGVHGAAGWPDRLFLGPGARCLWMEFKRPGKKLTPLQERRFAELRSMHWTPCVVSDVEVGKAIISLFAKDCRGP